VKCVVEGTVGPYNWANVMHFAYGGPAPSSGVCDVFATALEEQWNNAFSPNSHPSVIITGAKVTDLSSSFGGAGSVATTDAGTSTGTLLPGNAAFLVSKAIAFRYRGGHPRSYIVTGVQENLLDSGHWNTAFVTTTTSNHVAFLEGFVGTSSGGTTIGLECSVSYYGGAPPILGRSVRRAVPLVFDVPADGYSYSQELAAQRRRIGR
jgi:hypothetical protein